ncbi:MAG: efflux RND transporter permease subunit, partial [Clostridiales bacterium]|nr:efflux RND transporter permease subunit [Clostridiales bacterium]
LSAAAIEAEKKLIAAIDNAQAALLSVKETSETSALIDKAVADLNDRIDGLQAQLDEVLNGYGYTYEAAQPIKDALASAAEDLKKIFGSVEDTAKLPIGVLQTLLDEAKGVVEGMFGALSDADAAIVAEIKNAASSAVGVAESAMKGALYAAYNAAVGYVDDNQAGFAASVGDIKDWVRETVPAINEEIYKYAEMFAGYLREPQHKLEYKESFDDAMDGFFSYLGRSLGEILTPSLLDLAVFANNIEMPIGSANGTLITVGDKVKTVEELFNLPIAGQINIADLVLTSLTGFSLSDIDKANTAALTAMLFTQSILDALGSPDSTANGLVAGINDGLLGAGLSQNSILALFGLAGIDNAALTGWMGSLSSDLAGGGLSLSALIDASKTFDFVLTELQGANINLVLSDVANIVKLDNSSLLHTILNGAAGVQFNVNKSPSASTAEVSKAVLEYLESTAAADSSLKYVVLEDQGNYIQLVVDTILSNLIFGGLLAILILLFFLKKIGPTIVVGMSIVLSVILAFIMMYAAGIGLNIFSMAGIAIGVGMLVDNSIIVIENIFALKNQGKNIFEAALEGAGQVSGAVVASTITTIIVFVPLFFTSGIVTDMLRDFAVTMSFTIVASLIVAMTFVPMAATTFIKNSDKVSPLQEAGFRLFDSFKSSLKKRKKWVRVVTAPVVFAGNLIVRETSEKDGKFFSGVRRFYLKLLNLCLNKKVVPLVLVTVLFGGALITAFFMNNQVMPDLDMNSVNLHLNVDEGYLLAHDINEEDLLQTLMWTTEEKIGGYKTAGTVTDSGVSVYTGFKVMGSSVSDLSGGFVNTDGMFGGTMFSGVASGGDLECTVILADKKARKKVTAKEIAEGIRAKILESDYVESKDGVTRTFKIADFTEIGYDLNSLAEIAMLDSDYVQVNVYGGDSLSIEKETERLTALLKSAGINGITSVESTLDSRQLEYKLIVDKQKVSQKTGGYTATTLIELLNRFSTPGASATVTLTDETAARYTYNITFYPYNRVVKKWYRSTSSKYLYIYTEDELIE